MRDEEVKHDDNLPNGRALSMDEIAENEEQNDGLYEERSRLVGSKNRVSALERRLEKQLSHVALQTQSLAHDVEMSTMKLEMLNTDPLRNIKWRYMKNGAEVVNLSDEDDDGLEIYKLKNDIFSFLYCFKWYQPQFMFGLFVVVGIQTLMIVLLLSSSVDFSDDKNKLKVPGNVDTSVRATQILALIVAVFYEDDFREGVEGMIKGRPNKIRAHDDIIGMKRRQWVIAHTIRIIAGGFVLTASFLLLVQADNVFDVLLNFLGVSFASRIDDLAFFLCLHNYFGATLRVAAKKIADAECKKSRTSLQKFLSRVGLDNCGLIKDYSHSIIMTLIFLGFFCSYIALAIQQEAGAFLTETVYVEFGDQVVPFLGIFNGCYQMSNFIDGYPTYKQIGFETDGGMFGFCQNVEGSPGWTFSTGSDPDPCRTWEVKSGDTETYELYDSGKENWYTKDTHAPLEFIQISRVKNMKEECGRGMFEKVKDACEQLEPVGALSVMSIFRSESYKKLLLDSGTKDFLDEAHAHPIYIHSHEEGNHSVFDLVIFTGRRWVLTDTDHIEELRTASIQDRLDLASVTEFFQKPKNIHMIAESKQKWITLLSDEVPHATDSGTPVDLKWYEPEYHDEFKYHFPSPKLVPVDIMFECERCNNSTHPCKNEGFCAADGVCQCFNGATGAHCQDKPLGNGECNVFFNRKAYDFDGGDCCGGTCNGIECGYDGLHSAFGKNLTIAGFGYEHCKDPEVALITLEWKGLKRNDYCENGEEFCAIVSMNLQCDGRTYFDLPELRLDDEDDCEGPFYQTVKVPYGSRCHLESSQDWYDVHYDFAMYYGMNETLCQIHESNQDTSSVWFHIPTHCFSDALGDHLESFFDDSVQAKAAESLSRDTISDRLCENDHDLLVERYALKVLNESVSIENNNFESHQCQGWGGSAVKIECDEDHKITYLYVKDPRTEGTIPSELALLTQLTHLDFYEDPIVGTIPVELSLLTNLEFLDLGRTKLEGSIPTELFMLTNMKWLGFFEVPLSGEFPSEIGMMQKLTKLDIHDTGLTGTLRTEIGMLSNLISLEIAACNLKGKFPTEIGHLTKLRKLHLSNLDLRGTIPSEIGLLTHLTELILRNLGLTGTIPSEIQDLPQLEIWDLSLNSLAPSPNSMILTNLPVSTATNVGPVKSLYKRVRSWIYGS